MSIKLINSVALNIVLILVTLASVVDSRSQSHVHERFIGRYAQSFWENLRPHSVETKQPNIVIILTDDQDSELGSMQFMPKTLRILQDGGAHFINSFVTTPMCCPSRSSFLTGMYVHNHNVYTNNDNCSSHYWQKHHESRSFATYLKNEGYSTGYFGKYLNEYNGSHIPAGWQQWLGLVRNSRFYNYTVNFNGRLVSHKDNYFKDYFTDLIANDSVTFLKQSKQQYPEKPILMVLSMPAPHGPEDSAPQYQHLFKNVTTHRTPSWNFAPNPDKQWILQFTDKMEPIRQVFTDVLHRKRLQTLQSVDDAVEKVYSELKNIGELDNTYIIYTSDHGYHLGQYGIVKGKAMPYETDIRVPFYIRGPGIRRGVRIPHIVLNIDIAPTLLEMAGVSVPPHMDGKSVLNILSQTVDMSSSQTKFVKRKPWRDAFLLQRGKISSRMVTKREKMEAEKNNISRSRVECLKAQYQPPCKVGQVWVCIKNEFTGRFRFQKCRKMNGENTKSCQCPNVTIARPAKPTETGLKTVDQGILNRCRVFENSVVCDQDVLATKNGIKTQRDAVDQLIKEYRQNLKKLKKIKKHLRTGQIVRGSDKKDNTVQQSSFWDTDEECVCGTQAGTSLKSTREKRSRKTGKVKVRSRKDPGCQLSGVECYSMTNDHWKTEPKWTLGPFCACNNAANNSYWCVRNINDTHNFLYCEFLTGFISYYDLNRDPFQLRNAVHDLDFDTRRHLAHMLAALRSCQGSRNCTIRFKPKGYMNSTSEEPLGEEVVGHPQYAPDKS